MKIYIKTVFLVGFAMSSFAQITFNGCHTLFENQDYTFNFISTDATGRNIYTTTPVDGAQTCGGIGTCEFMIAWNDAGAQWEFIADDGNGNFSSPYLIYSNTSASTPNPPSLMLGTWTENSAITNGDCGGDLSTSNAALTGNVQDTVLGIENNQLINAIYIYPNPVSNLINIDTNLKINSIEIYNIRGELIMKTLDNLKEINVSNFHSGLYFLRIESGSSYIVEKIMID